MSTTAWRTSSLTSVALFLSAGVLTGCDATPSPESDPGTGTAESSSIAPTSASPSATAPAPGAGNEPSSGYVGAYDEAFRAELSSYTGQQVNLTWD
jgi:hypothetical protein